MTSSTPQSQQTPPAPTLHEDGDASSGKEMRGLRQRLLDSRTIVLSEGISPSSADRVVSSLLLLDSLSQEPIRLIINSPGGAADCGMAIFDTIRFVRSPVYVLASGLIASAGTIIFCAAAKERRLSMPHTRIMMHQPSTGVMGQASDIDIEAREIINFRNRVNQLIAEATGQTLERIETDQHRNFWMTAQEGVDYGLVGKIVTTVGEMG